MVSLTIAFSFTCFCSIPILDPIPFCALFFSNDIMRYKEHVLMKKGHPTPSHGLEMRIVFDQKRSSQRIRD